MQATTQVRSADTVNFNHFLGAFMPTDRTGMTWKVAGFDSNGDLVAIPMRRDGITEPWEIALMAIMSAFNAKADEVQQAAMGAQIAQRGLDELSTFNGLLAEPPALFQFGKYVDGTRALAVPLFDRLTGSFAISPVSGELQALGNAANAQAMNGIPCQAEERARVGTIAAAHEMLMQASRRTTEVVNDLRPRWAATRAQDFVPVMPPEWTALARSQNHMPIAQALAESSYPEAAARHAARVLADSIPGQLNGCKFPFNSR